MKKSFGSDNHSGIDPEILQAIGSANCDHALSYGEDEYSLAAEKIFKHHFGEQASTYFAFNGTGANILCLDAMVDSHDAIICAETAHINVDECGALQRITGARLLTVATPDGKLTPDLVKKHLHGFGFQHHSQPKVISITQPTELGTLYTPNEIKTLVDLAHQYNMYLHIDGARFANAAAALGCSFRQISTDLGVDALSFGGTKNGLFIGEAVVLLNPKLHVDFLYRRKQAMQLCSKTRFIAAQFIAYFRNDLWKRNAEHANNMAYVLYQKIKDLPTIKIMYPVESNAIFVKLPREIWIALQQKYFFYDWDESENIVRWMCSFDTTEDDILQFAYTLEMLIHDKNK